MPVLFSGYSLFLYFIGLARPGFTTVIILELLIGGVLMISLGIIGTYIAQIYQEVKYRPRYVVAETLTSRSDDELSHAQKVERIRSTRSVGQQIVSLNSARSLLVTPFVRDGRGKSASAKTAGRRRDPHSAGIIKLEL